jgi:hypothetical protein
MEDVQLQYYWILFYVIHNVHISTFNTGYTQKNGAVPIVIPIETAPFFCVCPVLIFNCILLSAMLVDALITKLYFAFFV